MVGGISAYNGSYLYNPYRMNAANPQQAQGSVSLRTQRAASPETPVEPVRPVTPSPRVAADDGLAVPIRMGADPVEMAVRMRIQYPGQETEAPALPGAKEDKAAEQMGLPEVKLPGAKEDDDTPGVDTDTKLGPEGAQAAADEGRCETCEQRKYQDGSDDMSVSFQTPTRIAPEAAASTIRGHEMEHVAHEQAKADREDRKIVSQTVTLHTEICPECGKPYISGGVTETKSVAKPEPVEPTAQEEPRTPFSAVA